MNCSVSVLYKFAIFSFYNSNKYLELNDNELFIVSEKKTKLPALIDKILSTYASCDENKKPTLLATIKVIHSKLKDNLEEKTKDLCWDIFNRYTDLKTAVEQLETVIDSIRSFPVVNEEVFRLNFLGALPSHLKVSAFPAENEKMSVKWRDGTKEEVVVNEWKFVEWLSKQVFESQAVQSLPKQEQWKAYSEIMMGAYRGDHILIEDDDQHTKATQISQFGAVVRASSHYETGRTIIGWTPNGHPKFGGSLRKDLLQSEIAHKGITGKHIKHLLFYPADMRKMKNGKLICAKTARQVDRLLEANNLLVKGKKIAKENVDTSKKHHYVALQFEYAPDSEGFNFFDWKFYQHRVYGFLTYYALKSLGIKHSNIGPYGYGKTDLHPVILNNATASK